MIEAMTQSLTKLGAIAIFLACTACGTEVESKQAPSGWVEDDAPAAKTTTGPVVQQSKNGKTMLKAGVEHSQELPALPASLRVGATFDNKLLSGSSSSADGWYHIPAWLAGGWHRDQETVIYSQDYQTGNENREPHIISGVQDAQFGVQQDRSGGIWHCRLARAGVADCGSYLSCALIQSQEPVLVSGDKVLIRDVFTMLHVNKETGAIIYSAQSESLTRYEPMQDGVIKTTSSLKTFDADGMPQKRQINVSYDKRMEPFSVLNSYKGSDLRTEFSQFLKSDGKENLIP